MSQLPNKPRRTRLRMEEEVAKMFELMVLGYTDIEMQKALGMTHATYYRYKNRMYKHYGDIHRNKIEDVICYQQQLLSDRLTKLYRTLELKLINDRSKMNGMEIASVIDIAQEVGINILKLECEGLRATNRRLNGMVQQKVSQYLPGYNNDDNNDGDSDDTVIGNNNKE